MWLWLLQNLFNFPKIKFFAAKVKCCWGENLKRLANFSDLFADYSLF